MESIPYTALSFLGPRLIFHICQKFIAWVRSIPRFENCLSSRPFSCSFDISLPFAPRKSYIFPQSWLNSSSPIAPLPCSSQFGIGGHFASRWLPWRVLPRVLPRPPWIEVPHLGWQDENDAEIKITMTIEKVKPELGGRMLAWEM